MLSEGRIPDNIYRRSVLKRFEMAGLKSSHDDLCETAVKAVSTSYGVSESIFEAALKLESKSRTIKGTDTAAVHLMFPSEITEEGMKSICDDAAAALKVAGITYTETGAVICTDLKDPVIAVSLFRNMKQPDDLGAAYPADTSEAADISCSGLDLVMAGHAGYAGSIGLFYKYENEIRGRFSPSFTESHLKYQSTYNISALNAVRTVDKETAPYVHTAGEGGIYAALWDFAEKNNCGLTAYLKEIPIRQETIEICDLYGQDPYMIYSGGCVLYATGKGNMLAGRLRQQGCPAAVIGHFTDSNDRVVINDDEKRFLTPYKGK